jgi:hypothetical protein
MLCHSFCHHDPVALVPQRKVFENRVVTQFIAIPFISIRPPERETFDVSVLAKRQTPPILKENSFVDTLTEDTTDEQFPSALCNLLRLQAGRSWDVDDCGSVLVSFPASPPPPRTLCSLEPGLRPQAGEWPQLSIYRTNGWMQYVVAPLIDSYHS